MNMAAIQHSYHSPFSEKFGIRILKTGSDIVPLSYHSHSLRHWQSISFVCFAEKPQKTSSPTQWKPSGHQRGDELKAIKLVKILETVSDVKEELYGTLDAWCAFDLEFPLVAVKKALAKLKYKWQWKRIIQVCKWMLSKGHGKTLATYHLLLEALEQEGRVEEAEEVFKGVFKRFLDALPKSHYGLMMNIYKRAGMYEKLLDVFADMEELHVKPDIHIVDMIAEVYEIVGMPEKSAKVRLKYPPGKWEYRYKKGVRRRVPVREIYGDELVNKMVEKHIDVKPS